MDIKLENIVLDANFNIKLIDFGFACHISGDSGSSYSDELKGTPAYMTPEMHVGHKYQPVVADMFSLGVLLFIMYTGVQPFTKADPSDGLYKHIVYNRLDLFWQCHE